MSQALYRKYRPKGWDEVIGQEHVVRTLRNAIAADRVGHAYLFGGPRGTGKTTLARLLAKAVNCLADDLAQRPCNKCANCKAVNENRFMDLIEIDAASNTGVDDIRDLRDKINFAPSQGRYKIYIIDEVHMLSTQAFNALLKTLEEPPPHAIFVLATTEIHKIPATVLSRCQRHEFRRVPVDEILSNLQQIVKAEGIQADDEALTLIARQATGSMRDAQSLLDQLSSVGGRITLNLAQAVLGTATSESVLAVIQSIREREPAAGLDSIHRALDSGADPRTVARQIVEYLRAVLLMQMGNSEQVEMTKELKARMAEDAQALPTADVLRLMKAFNEAAVDTRGGWQPSLSLELALAGAFESPAKAPTASHAAPGGGPGQTTGSSHGGPAKADSKGQASAALYQEADAQTPSAGTATGASAAISIDEVLRSWKDVRAAIKPAKPAVEALLNSCKPMDVRGDQLILGFQSETVRKLMDKPENLEATRKAVEDVLGVSLNIQCVVTSAKGKLPPNISQDGMVAAALNQGGKIVDMDE
ncbi:MAG TPA: DNA polymerase III subunit gamma/tau [Anaerolineales bacterium]|nr:DNA polymerase III subunit gamma/tau [Anaerolineales bacterium]